MKKQPVVPAFREPFGRVNDGDMTTLDNPIYASWRIKPNAHPIFAQSDFWIYYWVKKTGEKYYYSPPAKVYLKSHGSDYVLITADELASVLHAPKHK